MNSLRTFMDRTVTHWSAIGRQLRHPGQPAGNGFLCHMTGSLLWLSGVVLVLSCIFWPSLGSLRPGLLMLSGVLQLIGGTRFLWADRVASYLSRNP